MAKGRDRGSAAGLSQRQLQVGETLRRALSEVLMRGEAHGLEFPGERITVTEVRASPDLRNATAYVMPLGGLERERALAALAAVKGEIRRAVARKVRLKFTPDFAFVLDDTFDRYDETRNLLTRDEVKRDLD